MAHKIMLPPIMRAIAAGLKVPPDVENALTTSGKHNAKIPTPRTKMRSGSKAQTNWLTLDQLFRIRAENQPFFTGRDPQDVG